MSRENAHDKGRRYLVEGRLLLKAVSDHHVLGVVRGDGGWVHHVSADSQGFRCSCPSVRDCSHLVALRLVVVQPLGFDGPGPRGVEA